MERLAIRVPEDIAEEIGRRANDDGVSTSEAARQLLRRGTEYEALTDRIDELETDVARKERKMEAVIEKDDEHGELVRHVQEERELERQRERRRTAPVWKRAK